MMNFNFKTPLEVMTLALKPIAIWVGGMIGLAIVIGLMTTLLIPDAALDKNHPYSAHVDVIMYLCAAGIFGAWVYATYAAYRRERDKKAEANAWRAHVTPIEEKLVDHIRQIQRQSDLRMPAIYYDRTPDTWPLQEVLTRLPSLQRHLEGDKAKIQAMDIFAYRPEFIEPTDELTRILIGLIQRDALQLVYERAKDRDFTELTLVKPFTAFTGAQLHAGFEATFHFLENMIFLSAVADTEARRDRAYTQFQQRIELIRRKAPGPYLELARSNPSQLLLLLYCIAQSEIDEFWEVYQNMVAQAKDNAERREQEIEARD